MLVGCARRTTHRKALAVALVVREADLTRGERRQLEERAVTVLANREDLEARALRCELMSRVQPDAAALDFVLATI